MREGGRKGGGREGAREGIREGEREGKSEGGRGGQGVLGFAHTQQVLGKQPLIHRTWDPSIKQRHSS